MRTMELPYLPRKVEIDDLENLYKTRLKQKPERRAEIAIPLLGYMAWPNDAATREQAMEALRAWLEGGEPREFLKQIPLLHRNWGKVADIIQLHRALSAGGHQQRRRGASVGKAIYLSSQRIEARGTGGAKMWEGWSKYKDAGHLIAAAIAVCADMQRRNRQNPLGVGFQELLPVRVVCLVPELVIGVALHYQEYGLNGANMDVAGPMDQVRDPLVRSRLAGSS